MSGPYQVVDGRLVIGNLATTEMACEDPLMAQDQWLGAFLGGATATMAGDVLTLENGGVTMTLTDREAADPDRPLEGTHWLLDGIVAGDAVSSVPQGVAASIRIAEGRIDFDAGCNTGGAPAAVTPTSLTIGPLALTKRGCQAEAAAVEAAMTTVLTGEVAYSIEADRLTLTTGRSGLVFRAAP
jgi:heat shock protein HslJ